MALEQLHDKFQGTYVAFAIGDALGNPHEGSSRFEIKQRGRITDYVARWEDEGTTTDDTDILCLSTESLIDVGAFSLDDLSRRLQLWLPTSSSYGLATQEAIVRLGQGISPVESGVDSAGNGAIPRAVPLGLVYSSEEDADALSRTTRATTHITHKNPKAVAASYGMACALKYLLTVQPGCLRSDHFLTHLADSTRHLDTELSDSILRVGDYTDAKLGLALRDIGNSGYVQHSFPFALYCFLRTTEDLETSVLRAVNAGGDTDSNAAFVGALSGCYHGTSSIPQRWIDGLRHNERIRTLADRLYNFHTFLHTD